MFTFLKIKIMLYSKIAFLIQMCLHSQQQYVYIIILYNIIYCGILSCVHQATCHRLNKSELHVVQIKQIQLVELTHYVFEWTQVNICILKIKGFLATLIWNRVDQMVQNIQILRMLSCFWCICLFFICTVEMGVLLAE